MNGNTEKTWSYRGVQIPYWKGWSRYLTALVKSYRGKYGTGASWKIRTYCAPHMQSSRRQRPGFKDWREKLSKHRQSTTNKRNSRRNRGRDQRNQQRVPEVR